MRQVAGGAGNRVHFIKSTTNAQPSRPTFSQRSPFLKSDRADSVAPADQPDRHQPIGFGPREADLIAVCRGKSPWRPNFRRVFQKCDVDVVNDIHILLSSDYTASWITDQASESCTMVELGFIDHGWAERVNLS